MNESRQIRFGAVAMLLTLAVLASQRSATAGLIASNLGSGNSYNTSSGYTDSGPLYSGGGHGLGVEFQISGGSSIAFGSADLALEYHSGTNAINVMLMSNVGGLPGAALETISVTNIPAGPSLVVATSTTNTILTPGTEYWLVAIASGNTYMGWMQNNTGATNHLASATVTGSGASGWSMATGNPDVAFAINSVVVAAPAPPSVIMVGLGVGGVLGYGVKRRWRRNR